MTKHLWLALALIAPSLALAGDVAPTTGVAAPATEAPPPVDAAPPGDDARTPPPPPVRHEVISPAPQAQPQAKQRDRWYIGFGLGSGAGQVAWRDGSKQSYRKGVGSDPATLSFDFGVGATLTPKLLLGGELGAFVTSSSENGVDASVGTSYLDAVVTYFPLERGPFLRLGAGTASYKYTVEGTYSQDVDVSGRGANVLGGVGYAFWLGQTFNLVGKVDLSQSWFRNATYVPRSTTTVAGSIAFYWY